MCYGTSITPSPAPTLRLRQQAWRWGRPCCSGPRGGGHMVFITIHTRLRDCKPNTSTSLSEEILPKVSPKLGRMEKAIVFSHKKWCLWGIWWKYLESKYEFQILFVYKMFSLAKWPLRSNVRHIVKVKNVPKKCIEFASCKSIPRE